jgi:hypothetical protein
LKERALDWEGGRKGYEEREGSLREERERGGEKPKQI